jgi:hypothetical protein
MIDISTAEKAEILDRAADRLKGGRWTQGTIGCTTNPKARVCLAGSIEAVLGELHPEFVSREVSFGANDIQFWHPVDEDGSYFVFSQSACDLEDALLDEVAETLGPDKEDLIYWKYDVKWAEANGVAPPPKPPNPDPMRWNDEDGRTSRQVISALRRTAKRLRQEAQ